MKKMTILLAGLILMSLLIATANADSTYLEREMVRDEKVIRGSFTLILYGGRYFDDLETIAVLDSEEDEYTFEPYAPEFHYHLKKNMAAENAFKEAMHFVSAHSSFINAHVSRLVDRDGRVLGYEVRPIYLPLRYGLSDILDASYRLKGKKVTVYLYLKPFIKRPEENGDSKDIFPD